MTTILLDPAAMTATAGRLAENAMRVQETVTGTRTACTCEVPRSLIGWLDDALIDIAVSAMSGALAYLQAAVDCVGGGRYEGSGGRVGTISNVHRDPDRPGEFEVS